MNNIAHHILLIHCPDQKGLVSIVSNILYKSQYNIVEMKEHVDQLTNIFYMRCEFTGVGDANQIKSFLQKELPPNAIITVNPKTKKDIVVFATKEHHCLSDLLIRNHFGELDANIKCVVSNHKTLQVFVEKFNVDFHYVTHENKSKDEFEQELLAITAKHNPDFLVLAKFMRILSPELVGKYPNKIINIHHSFLPAFIGANPYQQAYNRGIKLIGATAHFVNEELDQGPIIAQQTKQVDHSFSADDMRISGKEIERVVLVEALQLALEDRVFVTGNKTVILN